jgi:two-component system CheB/CheR fusion protein
MSENSTLPTPGIAGTAVGAEQDAAALKAAKTPETMANSATTADSGPKTKEPGRSTQAPFSPVVGVGASAGGLAALEKLFTAMPPDTGAAFVIVQHMDTAHKSLLHELLRRYTPMPVVQVEDGMGAEPNHLYVIPPNCDMAILQGKLQLMELAHPRGLRLPIDYFFRSLAEDQRDHAIGIVLSGTGHDGALGLKSIKEEGGMAMVQTPESAEYDGMPISAIATGMVDFTLPPEQMPAKLVHYLQYFAGGPAKQTAVPKLEGDEYLAKIFVLLRNATGNDFSYYKPHTILRRLSLRLAVNQIDHLRQYLRYLQQHPQEVQTLFSALLIGVSSFFRDPQAFAALEAKGIPALFQNRSPNQGIRVWVPGCSTGEEAYSIAMLIFEYMGAQKLQTKVQIFATDIDSHAVATARLGIYPASIAGDVSPERLRRFFTTEGAAYQVNNTVRELVVFATQNLLKDPPFSKMDLISCRNLLIYLGVELQHKLLPLFHYALNPNGYLFLGTSEGIGDASDLFGTVDRRAKLYRRLTASARLPVVYRTKLDLPLLPTASSRDWRGGGEPKISFRELAQNQLLQDYAPAGGVLVNQRGEILYVHGRTGKFLELSSGEPNWDVMGMAREGLRFDLTGALRQAASLKKTIRHENIEVRTNGGSQRIHLSVKPVACAASPDDYFMVVFDDAIAEKTSKTARSKRVRGRADQRIKSQDQKLRSTQEYLQTTIKELGVSNEELKAANEELQSANEELQSTTEELETSKEELQAVNEELMTINYEHELKLEELAKAHNDMQNLLASTEIGTLFLDCKLCIQRFTPGVARIMNLIEADTGRPLRHLKPNLNYDHLAEDAQQVLDSLNAKEREVQSKEGNWYLVRIRPYRTTENVIEGVVLAFVEITEMKRLGRLESVIEASNDAITLLDLDGRILAWNRGAEVMYGWSATEALGLNLHELVPGDKREETALLLRSLAQGQTVQSFETQRATKDGRILDVWMSFSALKDKQNQASTIATIEQNITQRKAIETGWRQREHQLRQLLNFRASATDIREPNLRKLRNPHAARRWHALLRFSGEPRHRQCRRQRCRVPHHHHRYQRAEAYRAGPL